MNAFAYWESGEGLGNITPPANRWPEGESFKTYYPEIFAGQDVVEFGCGVGRLAPLFSASRYVGVDICRPALKIAREANRDHVFKLIDGSSVIEGGDVIFAHNVLMHIPDEDLLHTIFRFRQKRVVVSEVLGLIWRRDGDPPVFNREISGYQEAFLAAGYTMTSSVSKRADNYRILGKAINFGILEFIK